MAKHYGFHIIETFVIVMLAVKTEALGVVYPSAVPLMPVEHHSAGA